MNKHKKFIKNLYHDKYGILNQECKNKILERYPEFEPKEEFKEGEWVIQESFNDIYRITSINKSFAYGVNGDDKYGYCLNTIRKAKPEEIKSALIKEAERRGYKDGNYKCLLHPETTYHLSGDAEYFYDSIEDSLWIEDTYFRNQIYRRGKWAKIIKSISKEEIIENYKKENPNIKVT